MFKSLDKLSAGFVGFLQALLLVSYIFAIGMFVTRGEVLLGHMDVFAPVLFLTIFVTSALICLLIVFSYPFVLFWVRKKPLAAFRVVASTTAWLAVFAILTVTILAYSR